MNAKFGEFVKAIFVCLPLMNIIAHPNLLKISLMQMKVFIDNCVLELGAL